MPSLVKFGHTGMPSLVEFDHTGGGLVRKGDVRFVKSPGDRDPSQDPVQQQAIGDMYSGAGDFFLQVEQARGSAAAAAAAMPRSALWTASPDSSFGGSSMALPSPVPSPSATACTQETSQTPGQPPRQAGTPTRPTSATRERERDDDDELSDQQTPSPKRRRTTASTSPQPRYWCTACAASFDNRITWKAHEDQVHERQAKYPCPNPTCPAVFWDPAAFKRHHKEAHNCRRCGHAAAVVRRVDRRSRGYGCGVCAAYLPDQDAFLDHVASHWEAGHSRRAWHHSRVIYGLLHRPGVFEAWMGLLRALYPDPRLIPGFSWDVGRTGRLAGCGGSGAELGLQDALEMLGEVPGLGPAEAVRMAHDTAAIVPREDLLRLYAAHRPGCHVHRLGADMGSVKAAEPGPWEVVRRRQAQDHTYFLQARPQLMMQNRPLVFQQQQQQQQQHQQHQQHQYRQQQQHHQQHHQPMDAFLGPRMYPTPHASQVLLTSPLPQDMPKQHHAEGPYPMPGQTVYVAGLDPHHHPTALQGDNSGAVAFQQQVMNMQNNPYSAFPQQQHAQYAFWPAG